MEDSLSMLKTVILVACAVLFSANASAVVSSNAVAAARLAKKRAGT